VVEYGQHTSIYRFLWGSWRHPCQMEQEKSLFFAYVSLSWCMKVACIANKHKNISWFSWDKICYSNFVVSKYLVEVITRYCHRKETANSVKEDCSNCPSRDITILAILPILMFACQRLVGFHPLRASPHQNTRHRFWSKNNTIQSTWSLLCTVIQTLQYVFFR